MKRRTRHPERDRPPADVLKRRQAAQAPPPAELTPQDRLVRFVVPAALWPDLVEYAAAHGHDDAKDAARELVRAALIRDRQAAGRVQDRA